MATDKDTINPAVIEKANSFCSRPDWRFMPKMEPKQAPKVRPSMHISMFKLILRSKFFLSRTDQKSRPFQNCVIQSFT